MIRQHWHVQLAFDFGEEYDPLLVSAMMTRSKHVCDATYDDWDHDGASFAASYGKIKPLVIKWRCNDVCFANSTKEPPNDTED